jgi:hypothetical protein
MERARSPSVGRTTLALCALAVLAVGATSLPEAVDPSPATQTPFHVTRATPDLPWPTSVSANHRYLLDQFGNPYMIVGDAPHSLFVNLTEAQADAYFADRRAHGFDAAWIEVLCDDYTGGRSDGSTHDGIKPFTADGNFATPNPAYFQRVRDMVDIAAQHGITVFLDPIDTSGWQSAYESNGAAKDYGYGRHLGRTFKDARNILWLVGNDFQSWRNHTDNADVTAIANGIKSVDPNHLMTGELNSNASSSLDDASWRGDIDLNGVYTYYPTYDEDLHAYNQTPTTPMFMMEANYEFENASGRHPTTAETLRRQEWWTMTSGATGQMYGNHYTWDAGTDWARERANLDTSGVQQLQYMQALVSRQPWYDLVPDQTHSVLTGGMGTYDGSNSHHVLESSYATAAVTPDGSLGLVYVPTRRTVTVDLNRLSGTVTARWFDPTTGAYQDAGTGAYAPNSGSRQFATPSTAHSDGARDWVLILHGNGSG